MRVAFVHYHLRPGGVTRVIENACSALIDSDVSCCILAGEIPESFSSPTPSRIVADLGYNDGGQKVLATDTIVEMRSVAEKLLGGPPDIWHIHNPSLGKSPHYHRVINELARQGERLLLQIHDFAEDGRPGNYDVLRQHDEDLERNLYPIGDRIHYALLNGRDHQVLKDAGGDEDQLHFLPNAVELNLPSDVELRDDGFILYPSRGIRRKNVGEVLLWATQAQGDEELAITLSPQNPVARASYTPWVELAKRLELPIQFDVGQSTPFAELLRQSRCLFTTSVAEGFGLAFVESWFIPKRIVGRDLPEITNDFREEGLDLPGLYDALPIPLDWLDESRLRSAVKQALEAMYENYGRELPATEMDQVMESLTENDMVDFGRLNEAFQEDVVCRALHEGPPPCLVHPPWRERPDPDLLEKNAACVQEKYSLPNYRSRLESIYDQLLNAEGDHVDCIPASRIVTEFLRAHRFNLLRTI